MSRFDPTTFEPSRLMYWPSTPEDGEYVFRYTDQPFLDPDAILATYADWRDASLWPTTKPVEDTMKRTAAKQDDPLEKTGIIGAFCRAHALTDVLETTLKDFYTATGFDDRYTLAILADTEDIDRKMARAVKKEQEVAQLMRVEVDQNAHAAQDQADYNMRYGELTERFNAAHAETIRLTETKAKRSGRALRLTAYLDTLRRRDSLLTEFDEGLWAAVVQDVTVRENGDMTFRLRDGSEQEYVRDV